VSRKENWKVRLFEMKDAVTRIREYCVDIKSAEAFTNDRKTVDACVRNFQILGDAAKKVPTSVQKQFPKIPWNKIKGLRNFVVHEYFGVDARKMWTTVSKNIPDLETELLKITDRLEATAHPWKICGPGEVFVSGSDVDAYERGSYEVSAHLRSQHCRILPSSTKNVLSISEIRQIELNFEKLKLSVSDNNLGYGTLGNEYNSLIAGWVQYWNEALKPDIPLDPDLVKALLASESSFQKDSNRGKRNAAKGLSQLLPATLNYLRGEKNELADHHFEFEDKDAFDPSFNIAAGIRWLYRKRETASARLKRNATWEESVAEYKDYLWRKLKNPKQKQEGMEKFKDLYGKLKIKWGSNESKK
jgi:uncharacterized protein with HEPN domain